MRVWLVCTRRIGGRRMKLVPRHVVTGTTQQRRSRSVLLDLLLVVIWSWSASTTAVTWWPVHVDRGLGLQSLLVIVRTTPARISAAWILCSLTSSSRLVWLSTFRWDTTEGNFRITTDKFNYRQYHKLTWCCWSQVLTKTNVDPSMQWQWLMMNNWYCFRKIDTSVIAVILVA